MNYKELILIPDFFERYRYLKLGGVIGEETFGWERYLNQQFYHSREWKQIRRQIITRDAGCDMAFPGREICGRIYIHHINPIEPKDIYNHMEILLDPDNLVCVSKRTHDAIHYGDESMLVSHIIERKPNDTIPWR